MKKIWGRFSILPKLVRDERASILLQFTLYVVVAMGMVGLALDGGRYMLLNNDLQDLADAAALAGAAELDGASDAITRATNAATNLASGNNVRWSDAGSVKIQNLTFYSKLNPDTQTTDPKQAAFIKVTTGTWQIVPSFLVAVGATTSNSTSASAVAGVSFNTCAPVASYVCNPFESNPSSGNAASFPGNIQSGAMFHLLTGGSGGPGSWGLLDLPAGVKDYNEFFAQVSSGTCDTNTRTGNRTGNGQHKDIQSGINVRFDRSGGNGVDNIAAPIVIDGWSNTGSGNSCSKPGDVSTATPLASLKLPRDTTFNANNIGNGPTTSDLNNYWKNHHNPSGSWPTDPQTGNPLSRYQVYQLEVAGAGSAGTWLTDAVEPHGPQCLPRSSDPRRRVISVAIVDCNYWGVHGNSTFQYTKYADFFLTDSAETSGSDASIYAEYVQTYSPNDPNGTLHKTVKLVR